MMPSSEVSDGGGNIQDRDIRKRRCRFRRRRIIVVVVVFVFVVFVLFVVVARTDNDDDDLGWLNSKSMSAEGSHPIV
jgi:hypothetical protein